MKKLLLTEDGYSFVFMWRPKLHVLIVGKERSMCGTTVPSGAIPEESRIKAEKQVCKRCADSAVRRRIARLEESEATV